MPLADRHGQQLDVGSYQALEHILHTYIL
jgi:hypothetical protein